MPRVPSEIIVVYRGRRIVTTRAGIPDAVIEINNWWRGRYREWLKSENFIASMERQARPPRIEKTYTMLEH